jgi:hypothetical protein
MNQESHNHHEDDGLPLPPGGEPDPSGVEGAREVTIEFGHLDHHSPVGGSWGEFVVARGIEAAERDDRPIDNRTASYIAAFLSRTTTPALRALATTGAVYMTHLEEEAVSILFDQTTEVQIWISWLANYWQNREDVGPVENWRAAIKGQDRDDGERLRREGVAAKVDDIFQAVEPFQRVGNGDQPGWHGLVRHEGRPGGWIISEGGAGERRVWETDSDAELESAFVEIVEVQQQWVARTFGGTRQPSGHEGHREGETED